MTAGRNSIVKSVFFGNYFYGLCAVALSVEASLQQEFPLNSRLYYVLVFLSAVFYYTLAYMGEPVPDTGNPRAAWYAKHHQSIRLRQWTIAIAIAAGTAIYLAERWQQIMQASFFNWLLILIFPSVAAMYYGISSGSGRISLRSIGWLKPFIIGFTWAGFVTVYPVLFESIEDREEFVPAFRNVLLFIKNFMFVSVLCILFDIKDYANDANQQLKTFVVNTGLRKTIFYIIIPLAAVGLGSFLLYAVSNKFSLFKVLLNTIPFMLLITVAYSLHRRRSILYYLAIIDGLMLAKAICGIVAMSYF
jgi:4-hydroxybenzoate polyprenyltransferase